MRSLLKKWVQPAWPAAGCRRVYTVAPGRPFLAALARALAAGDLPGIVKLTLVRSEANVTGGNLSLTVLPANADASSNERGALNGTVTSGTLTLSENGTLASASSVEVSIQSGAGEFAGVTSGTATINISAGAENPSQLSGTLVLNF